MHRLPSAPILWGLVPLLAILWLAPAPADARSLYWPRLEVDARLDAQGQLHVIERQTFSFTGDWNGGERVFNLRSGQSIEFKGMTRRDAGAAVDRPMVRGSLSTVDNYNWKDKKTLRWRARQPGDPVFNNTRITYSLEYILSGVLQRAGEGYRLDHDFAFPDRQGVIEQLVITLQLDPAWQADRPSPIRREQRNLQPDQSAVLTLELTNLSGAQVAARRAPAPAAPREFAWAVFALVFGVILWLMRRWRRQETEAGRYEEIPTPARLDRAWIKKILLALRPEEAGALWDRRVGAPEVAAVLARLVSEKKLSSEVKPSTKRWGKDVLHLKRLVEFDAFDADYDRKLVRKLFYSSRKNTNTEAIKKHYKAKGFRPAEVIRKEIDKRLTAMGFVKNAVRVSRKPSLWLWAAIVVLLVLEGITRSMSVDPLALLIPFGLLWPYVFGLVFAFMYRPRLTWLGLFSGMVKAAIWMVFLTFLIAVGAGPVFLPDLALGYFGLVAAGLIPVVIANHLLNVSRTRENRATLDRRKQILAVRDHLAAELNKANPNLDDDWFPYLLALGLEDAVDDWFKEHGTRATRSYVYRSRTTSGSSAGGWSGGGGSFGGAGAAAGWAVAASGLAAGVASPASSGGGSGGGGSSGGGGGGGW